MRYILESSWLRDWFVRCLVLQAFMVTGCATTHGKINNADSAVACWESRSVWFVANGSLPRELAGWHFVSEEHGCREPCDVRVTSPDGALDMLREWSTRKKVDFALFPLAVADLTEKKFGAGLLEQLSEMSASLAKEKGGTYLVVFTPPEEADKLRSMLTSAGLRDDTLHFLNSLAQRLQALADILEKHGSRKAAEGR